MRRGTWIAALALAGCTTLLPGTDTFGDASTNEDGGQSDAGMDAGFDGGLFDAGELDASDERDAEPFDAGPDAGASPIPIALALGERHSCALLRGGRVACWGDDRSGQVSTTPIVGPPNWRAPTATSLPAAAERVCAGGAFTCAATARVVFCWGDNSRGQLATGDLVATSGRNPVMFPGQPPSSTIDDLGCGQEHACAIVNGATYCWGDNQRGQVDATSAVEHATPVLVRDAIATDAFDSVFLGRDHTCASSTTTECWGENMQRQICAPPACGETVPIGTPTFVGRIPVATGGDFTVGFTSSTVRVFTNAVPNLAPLPPPAEVDQIRAGDRLACWANAAGEIRCWGDVVSVLGATSNPSSPYVAPSGSNASAFDVGYGHLCGIANDEIWCAGANGLRQASPMGSAATRVDTPTLVPLSGI